jgi:hypothetical protein
MRLGREAAGRKSLSKIGDTWGRWKSGATAIAAAVAEALRPGDGADHQGDFTPFGLGWGSAESVL